MLTLIKHSISIVLVKQILSCVTHENVFRNYIISEQMIQTFAYSYSCHFRQHTTGR